MGRTKIRVSFLVEIYHRFDGEDYTMIEMD